MKRILFLLVLGAISWQGMANHIVGGELELIHIQGFNYRINLIQYFDLAQDANPGPEASIIVYTYRKSDDVLMRRDTITLQGTSLVQYTNILCVIDELRTLRAEYSKEIFLDPEEFSDEEGYYMVWERCCRNFAITNILNPGGTGMTYLLDFPPVTKNNEPFVNSSPQLFPPLSDYACVDQLYYVDFAGTDLDGDSITYSLTTPLNSTALVPVPIPTPKPHPEVRFRPGVDVNNMVPGSPSLQINNEGFITVRPNRVGLYVFSVLAEEFRDGEKIGQVRRDYQLLVVDGCNPPAPPQASVKIPGEPDFDPRSQTLNYTVGAEDRCFEFLVRDNSSGISRVNLRAEGVNFEGDVSDILSVNSGFLLGTNDTLVVEVCVDKCPYIQDGPYIIDLIAADDACPLPQQDTVRLTINVEPPPNNDPFFSSLPTPEELIFMENENRAVTIVGEDADFDPLSMTITPVGFNAGEYGFEISNITTQNGLVERRLSWNTDCGLANLGDFDAFTFLLELEDADECNFEAGVQQELTFSVELPENTAPEVTADISTTTITAAFNSTLSFAVNATDADGDQIVLSAVSEEGTLAQLGASFPSTQGAGNTQSNFTWPIDCDNPFVSSQESFTFYFVAEDLDECQDQNADTLTVEVNLVVPENNAPVFDPIEDLEVLVNQQFTLTVTARDEDGDFLTLRLLRQVFFDNFDFPTANGQGVVTSDLIWTPDCSLLGPGNSPETYQLSFLVEDNRCPEALSDTLNLSVTLREPSVGEVAFNPANAFSPNADGFNDTFRLTNLEPQERNLPPEACDNFFEYIRIVDRTGKEVFYSEEKQFSWDGEDQPAGTYYYFVKYTQTEYKGYVTMVY